MKKLVLITCLILCGCGTAAKVYRVADPRDVNRDSLTEMQPRYTSRYRIPYVKSDGVDQSYEWWSGYIDNQMTEYAACVRNKFGKDPQINKLKNIKIIIVKDSKFECKYHNGRCSGEYDAERNIILVARKDFGKEGFIPLLKHEWSHANGILKSDHSNLDYVQKCTRY